MIFFAKRKTIRKLIFIFESNCMCHFSRLVLLFLLVKFLPVLSAQKVNNSYQYQLKKTDSPVHLDGILDDQAWASAQLASDFFMILPMDTSFANIPTDVKMTYDDKYLYFSVVNYVPHQRFVVESLRRDWNFGKNDNFLIVFDTYNDLTNGFAFGINAAGAQWDGQQYDGGPVNLNWDNKWYSVVKQYEDKWVVEAAIPFKSIRYNKDLASWGVNFGRMDLTSTEKSSWAPVPRQFPSISSAFTGNLVWDNLPPKPGANVSVIPYALAGTSKSFSGNDVWKKRFEAGGDIKVSLGTALNLDLTYNPDFSQVEVDQQQTNLDRFELFFPERRQFFLENDDLFNNLGLDRIRPFFSRRIGLGVPINYGARLSGKLNKSLRIGAMQINTAAQDEGMLAAQNFTVISVQQKVFSRSNIMGVLINKDELGGKAFNRNMGMEYNLASANNKWRGKFMYYQSAERNQGSDAGLAAAQLNYNDRKWTISGQIERVGASYDAEVGFVPRTSYYRLSPRIGYNFFPAGSKVLSHSPSFFHFSYFDLQGRNSEYTTGLMYNVEFRQKSVLSWYAAKDYIRLLVDFDPTNFTGISLPAGSQHHWASSGINFTSKPQSLFTYGFQSRIGGYFSDGFRIRLAGDMAYRFQPYVQLAIAAEYNDINLKEELGLKDARFWLIGPKIDITLTNNLYFTTFIQYNEQIKNLNINSRLQWRYKPVSDIFLVYTDNYGTENLHVKNRAIVLKATYWGNI